MRLTVNAVLLLGFVGMADAHRLDEYLQATLIGVTPNGVDVEVQLTPGVAILPVWMPVIDQDRDGRISADEQQSYVKRFMRDVELRVDGVPVPLSLVDSDFPAVEAMRGGLGTIVLKLRAARRGHELRFENRHFPQVSAYLVNCLADPSGSLRVGKPVRDEAQKSIMFEYSFGAASGPRAAWIALEPFWPVAIGAPLLARMVLLAYGAAHRPPARNRSGAAQPPPGAF